MMNDIQKRILAEAVKFGGSDISKIQTIANTLSEMPMVDSPSSAGTLFGHSATQFEVKMRQVMKKMGYEKGILGMKLYGSLMHIWFANEGKAKDFVLVLNQMTRRVSTGTVAIHSTMFDPKTEKQFTGAKAKVIVNFSKIKKEEFETEDGLMTFLESESETVCVEDIEEAAKTSQEKIAEFIISDKKRFYVKVTKHPTNKNALLVTSSIDSPSSGGSPRQISKSDFMSFIKSYDKDNVGPKGKEHYYVDYDDGTYQFKIGETWQKLFLGNSMSQLSPTARIAHIGHTYPKINSYHDWLQAISKSAMNEDIEEVVSEAKQAPQITEKMIRDDMRLGSEEIGKGAMMVLRSGWCANCNKERYAVVFLAKNRTWWGEISGTDKRVTYKNMGKRSLHNPAFYKFDAPGEWKDTTGMKYTPLTDSVEVDDGESIEEAFSPDQVPAHLLGGRFRNEKDKIFEYRLSTDAWGLKHGLPHEIFVLDGKQTRACLIKGTVAYISTDEDAEGKPVLQKWKIKQHVKYLKHYESTESAEQEENL